MKISRMDLQQPDFSHDNKPGPWHTQVFIHKRSHALTTQFTQDVAASSLDIQEHLLDKTWEAEQLSYSVTKIWKRFYK